METIVLESVVIVFAIFSPAIFVAAYTEGGDSSSSLFSVTLFEPLSPYIEEVDAIINFLIDSLFT